MYWLNYVSTRELCKNPFFRAAITIEPTGTLDTHALQLELPTLGAPRLGRRELLELLPSVGCLDAASTIFAGYGNKNKHSDGRVGESQLQQEKAAKARGNFKKKPETAVKAGLVRFLPSQGEGKLQCNECNREIKVSLQPRYDSRGASIRVGFPGSFHDGTHLSLPNRMPFLHPQML